MCPYESLSSQIGYHKFVDSGRFPELFAAAVICELLEAGDDLSPEENERPSGTPPVDGNSTRPHLSLGLRPRASNLDESMKISY